MYKTKMRSVLLCSLVIPVVVQPCTMQACPFFTDALAVGAAVLGAGALVSWLCEEPSDEDLLSSARRAEIEANNLYGSLLSHVESRHNVNPKQLTSGDKRYLIRNVREQTLFDIAEAYFRVGSRSIDSCTYELKTTVNKLDKQYDRLSRRFAKLVAEDCCYVLEREMEAAARAIDTTRVRLSFLYDYLGHHAGYFKLYTFEDELWQRYRRELDMLRECEYDRLGLAQELRVCVSARASLSNSSYPFINYVETINKDMRKLDELMGRLPYNYADRIGWVRNMLGWLNEIKSIVIADSLYSREQRERAARLEYERVMAANAAAAYNTMREQELRELRRENRIRESGCDGGMCAISVEVEVPL